MYTNYGHTDPEVVTVLKFNISEGDYTLLERQILKTDLDGDIVKIEVYEKEGPIPHFHLSNNDKSIDTCICIYEAKYFSHGHYQTKLNSKQRKILDKILRTPYDKDLNVTYWSMIAFAWDIQNERKDYKSDFKQPDYTKLK